MPKSLEALRARGFAQRLRDAKALKGIDQIRIADGDRVYDVIEVDTDREILVTRIPGGIANVPVTRTMGIAFHAMAPTNDCAPLCGAGKTVEGSIDHVPSVGCPACKALIRKGAPVTRDLLGGMF